MILQTPGCHSSPSVHFPIVIASAPTELTSKPIFDANVSAVSAVPYNQAPSPYNNAYNNGGPPQMMPQFNNATPGPMMPPYNPAPGPAPMMPPYNPTAPSAPSALNRK